MSMGTMTRTLRAVLVGAVVTLGSGGLGQDKPSLIFEYQGLVPKDWTAGASKAEAVGKDATKPSATRAASWNEAAICHYLDGEYDKALACIDEALKLQKTAAYHSNRGMINRIKGDLAAAGEDYKQALKLDPNSPIASNNLGWLYLVEAQSLKADSAARTRKLKDAEELFQKAVDLQKGAGVRVPIAQVNLAAAKLLLGEPLEGSKAKVDSVKSDPSVPAWAKQCALLNLGEIARCQGDWKEAERFYELSYDCASNPYKPPPPAASGATRDEAKENPWILQRLGAAKLVLGKYVEAADFLERARAKFGTAETDARYARLLAAIAEAHRDGAGAIKLDSVPKKPQRWIDALEMYLAGTLNEEALKGAATDANPAARGAKQCEMYYYMGQKRLLEKKEPEAKECFRKCREADDTNRRLESTMAMGG
jgi:tetratricopeptide (TPR) repeat protein